jgi:6,7-dimethyl-8-ribityllumazine synthase
MATSLKNLSDYDRNSVPHANGYRFGILVSEWNYEITGALAQAAVDTLEMHGVKASDIVLKHVPGSYELSSGALFVAQHARVDAVICIGCVIQGDTPHFDYICQAIAQGVTNVSLQCHIPVIFGVLTTNTQQQAQDRAGGKHGNKGVEAAVTAIKMVVLQKQLIEQNSQNQSDK